MEKANMKYMQEENVEKPLSTTILETNFLLATREERVNDK